MATQASVPGIRFGEFEMDERSGELRRNGCVIRLQPQPAKVLAILVERAGELVTRQELAEQLWGSDTFVDFEHGLNYAIQQIRSVLGDDPKQPRFLETVPKKGYRFIAVVTRPATQPVPEGKPSVLGARRSLLLLAGAAAAVAGILLFLWLHRRVAAPPSSAAQKVHSLAVLPLRNLSNDPEQEFFADGMTDELITNLAKSGELRVISHTSVERYKASKSSVPEIAAQLGVDALVEGTVMRSGHKVRITAQLIDARSDQHLWAETYERDLQDVFLLQDEIATRIASEIGATLLPQQHSAKNHIPDATAHEDYLRGSFYWNQLSCEAFEKARRYFQQAVDADPAYARAYVGLAQADFTLADWGCSPNPQLVAQSRTALSKALELDPGSGEAHAWLGKFAFFYGWNLPEAESEMTKAIELSPNYAEAHIMHAVLLATKGDSAAAIAETKNALAIDPTSQLTNVVSTFVYYLVRQYDNAVEQGKKTLEMYPASESSYDWLAASYERQGRDDLATAAYLKSKEASALSPADLQAFRNACRKLGVRGYWQTELKLATSAGSANACWIERIQAHLGRREETLQALDRSLQQHCSGPHTVIADPVLDGFRHDARFQKVLESVGLPLQ